jgi:hypothetical protein
MNAIQIEYSSDRHQALIADIKADVPLLEMVTRHKLTDKTIQRIKRHIRQFKTFEITLTDGLTTMKVASVTTRKDFIHACRHVVRKYSGSFNRLELPQWVLIDGEDRVKLVDLRAEMQG